MIGQPLRLGLGCGSMAMRSMIGQPARLGLCCCSVGVRCFCFLAVLPVRAPSTVGVEHIDSVDCHAGAGNGTSWLLLNSSSMLQAVTGDAVSIPSPSAT